MSLSLDRLKAAQALCAEEGHIPRRDDFWTRCCERCGCSLDVPEPPPKPIVIAPGQLNLFNKSST